MFGKVARQSNQMAISLLVFPYFWPFSLRVTLNGATIDLHQGREVVIFDSTENFSSLDQTKLQSNNEFKSHGLKKNCLSCCFKER